MSARSALHCRPERLGARHLPELAETRVVGAVKEFARPQGRVELLEARDLARRYTAREMRPRKFVRVVEAGGRDQFGERLQCGGMKILDPHPFVADHERTLEI